MYSKSDRGISKVSAAVITALSLSTSSLPVLAEEATSENKKIEVIMVSAQKRVESLQEVPISMSVATEAQLERDQINTLQDLQRIAPGLEIQPAFGGDASGGGRVRGIGTNIFNEGASGSVAVVVDEVPSGNIAMPSIFDMSQVEVLRGPQGTLFGQSASVGVINITTKAPDPYEFSGYAGLNYSTQDFDQLLLEGSVNIPINEQSALRLSMRSDVNEGQHNVYLNQTNESDTKSYRARYLLEASDELTIDLSAEYHDITRDQNFFALQQAPLVQSGPFSAAAQTNILLNCSDNDESYIAPEDRVTVAPLELRDDASQYCSRVMPTRESDYLGLAATVNWDIEDFTFTSISSYREKNLDDKYLNYARILGNGPGAKVFNTGREGIQWTQEFRLATNTNENYSYIVGAFASNYNTTTHPTNGGSPTNQQNLAGFNVCSDAWVAGVPFTGPSGNSFCAGPDNFPSFLYEDIDVSVQALFIDGTYDIDEEISVFGGLRLTKQSADYSFISRTWSGGETAVVGGKDDSEPSGRLGIRWKQSKDAMYYASIARGFKGSLVTPNERNINILSVLNPEISTSFEIGSKISIMDNSIVLDSNIFYMTVDDYQAQTSFIFEDQLVSQPVSISEVVSYGIELNARGNIGDYITLNAGYLYNSAEYPDGYLSDDPESLGGQQDLGGTQLYLAPEHKITISADYYTEVGDTMEAYLSVNANYKSDILMSQRVQEGYNYDAHWNLGASIGVRSNDGIWNVSLYGRNLTDEAFPVAVLASQFAGGENGGIRVLPGNGITNRQIGLLAKYNF